MPVSDRTADVGRYAQQLLDNQDVQDAARQAAEATRAAYRRARGQAPREAVQDKKLRRRVSAAVTSVGALLGAVSQTPAKPKSRWPRRILVLAVLGVLAWLITDEQARARIQGWTSQANPDDQPDPAAVPGAEAAPPADASTTSEQKESA